jgi:hypothetical protein
VEHVALWLALAVIAVVAIVATRRVHRIRAEELAAADAPSRRELAATRRAALEPRELRLLAPRQLARYLDGWDGVEATFAGDPEAGIAEADHITRDLAAELGYPGERFHTLAEALALDFPDEIEAFCTSHAIAVANEHRPVSHRQLRRALRGYRALFVKLAAPVRFTDVEPDTPLAEVHERRRQRATVSVERNRRER